MRLTITAFALIVPILVRAGSVFDSECAPNEWVGGGCEVNPHLCQIECSGDPCTATGGAPGPCSASGDIAQSDMGAAKCQELCEASRNGGTSANPDICRYWRYETVPTSDARVARVKTCTFLRGSECTAHEECKGDCQCGDVGCPGTQEGTTESPTIACKGGIEYHPDADWIHWICVNDEVPDLSSPYHPGDDAVMPPNTICFTTHQCSDWASEPSQQLSVTCDGLTGKWVQNGGTPDDPNGHYEGDEGVLGSQPAPLLEHQCKADPRTPLAVKIDNMGDGAQLSCETPAAVDEPPTMYTITPPNKCVLLCDFHLVMVIEGRLSDEGEFKFYVANTDEEINADNVDDMIKCWP